MPSTPPSGCTCSRPRTAARTRRCPSCADGRLGLKLGRYGPFVGCANYPDCKYTRPLAENGGDATEPRTLGNDPETGLPVLLKRGPYGLYVERGVEGGSKEKPKRVSLPQDLAPDLVDLQTALGLLALPREIGTHPETGKPITAGIGRFGAYVKHDGAYRSLPRGESVLEVGLKPGRGADRREEGRRAAPAGARRPSRRRPGRNPPHGPLRALRPAWQAARLAAQRRVGRRPHARRSRQAAGRQGGQGRRQEEDRRARAQVRDAQDRHCAVEGQARPAPAGATRRPTARPSGARRSWRASRLPLRPGTRFCALSGRARARPECGRLPAPSTSAATIAPR